MRKHLNLTVKFDKEGKVECARSSEFCKNCPWNKDCEEIRCYYDPYDDIQYCRKNDYRKR